MKRCVGFSVSVIVFVSLVVATSNQVVAAETTQGTNGEMALVNLRTLQSQLLARRMTNTKRQETSSLLSSIALEAKFLGKKTPWNFQKGQGYPWQRLKSLLEKASDSIGIEVAFALLRDTEEENYTRQTALAVIVGYNHYELDKNLPMLCQILGNSPDRNTVLSHLGDRYWRDPSEYRVHLAERIGLLLGVDVSAHEQDDKSPLVKYVAADDPKLWLTNALQYAMTLKQNEAHQAVIRQCLDQL